VQWCGFDWWDPYAIFVLNGASAGATAPLPPQPSAAWQMKRFYGSPPSAIGDRLPSPLEISLLIFFRTNYVSALPLTRGSLVDFPSTPSVIGPVEPTGTFQSSHPTGMAAGRR